MPVDDRQMNAAIEGTGDSHEALVRSLVIAAIDLFNSDFEAGAVASGWIGDFGLVADDGVESLAAYVGAPESGRLPRPIFESLKDVEQRCPRYFARASREDWMQLLSGTLDPIAALVQKRLQVRGDLQPIVERLKFRDFVNRWLRELQRRGTIEWESPNK